MNAFQRMVTEELRQARGEFPKPIHSVHEGFGLIAEEQAELLDAIRQDKTNKDAILQELVQVAAMCQATAEDLLMKDICPACGWEVLEEQVSLTRTDGQRFHGACWPGGRIPEDY